MLYIASKDVGPSVDHGLIGYELVKRGVPFAVVIFVWTKNGRCHEKMKRSCGNSRDSLGFILKSELK